MIEDEVPDVVVVGVYLCPSCGASFDPPEQPGRSMLVRHHGLLIELVAEVSPSQG